MFRLRESTFNDELLKEQKQIRKLLVGDLDDATNDKGEIALAYASMSKTDPVVLKNIYANIADIRTLLPSPCTDVSTIDFSKLNITTAPDEPFYVRRLPLKLIENEPSEYVFVDALPTIPISQVSVRDFELRIFKRLMPFRYTGSFLKYIKQCMLFVLGLPENFNIQQNDIDSTRWEGLYLTLLAQNETNETAMDLFISDQITLKGNIIDTRDIPKFNVSLIEPPIALQHVERKDLGAIKKLLETFDFTKQICFDTSNETLTNFVRVLPFHKSHIVYPSGRHVLIKYKTKPDAYSKGYAEYVSNDVCNNAKLIANNISYEQLLALAINGSSLEIQLGGIALLRYRTHAVRVSGYKVPLPSINEIALYLINDTEKRIMMPNTYLPPEFLKQYIDLVKAIAQSGFNKMYCAWLCSQYRIIPAAFSELFKELTDDAERWVLCYFLFNLDQNCALIPYLQSSNPEFGQNEFNETLYANLKATPFPTITTRVLDMFDRYYDQSFTDEHFEFNNDDLNQIAAGTYDVNLLGDLELAMLISKLLNRNLTKQDVINTDERQSTTSEESDDQTET